MNSGNIYAHPAVTTTPAKFMAMQASTGLRAIVDGHRIRLIQPAGQPGQRNSLNPSRKQEATQ